ncbi:MAG: hypothetical protein IJ418_10925 [Clostridia bacterium]|nr:hypothetical protein [Clostridia bacterium]
MFDLIEKRNPKGKTGGTANRSDAPITALYERLSCEDELDGESNSVTNHDLRCKGWFHRLIRIAAARLW